MQYSFIKPRAKNIISSEFKLLFFFFSITLGMLLVTYSFLKIKTMMYDSHIEEKLTKGETLRNNIVSMHTQIASIKMQDLHSEGIYTENTVLKESIHNLFDLVPEKITLSHALLKENELVLYGITPSKEVYEFLLQAPLRSIFHRSYTSYYAMPNGWYSFVSTNYLDRPIQ
ncbi:hypothetical protein JHD50_11700 [Sulfurimonas sp. MAG313]|nr:hypothetical protein [Sulfurimonas sp. MAG313]MDF1881952.1 hypothetical protein [Sulfurimonas sp. MAG313]